MSKRMEGPRWGWIVLTIWGIFSFLPILFFASIAHLPLLLVVMVGDAVVRRFLM
jgi:hypothetical protein